VISSASVTILNMKGLEYEMTGCLMPMTPIALPQNLSVDLWPGSFCGTEYYAAMEPASFTLSNTTDLHMDPQDVVSPGSDNGAACSADYLLLPGGHCKNDPGHRSTDRFCGNAMGVMGIKQPVISYSKPFMFRIVTDADEITSSVDYMNRGFHLKYHQLPCSSARH
jgi:hypothetical protein